MAIKINNSMIFMENIEKLVQKTKMSYIDAIMYYCEENKLEPETAGHMIGGKLKQKVQEEAEELNLIPKTSKLPIQELDKSKIRGIIQLYND